MKVGGPSPDRAPVGQETLERFHQTSGIDKILHMTSHLKIRQFRLCVQKIFLSCVQISNELKKSREIFLMVVYCLTNANEPLKEKARKCLLHHYLKLSDHSDTQIMTPKMYYKAGKKPHIYLLWMIYHMLYLSF